MILLFGGAFQGKLTYATETWMLQPEECQDCTHGLPEHARCLYHLEEFTRSCALQHTDSWEQFSRSFPAWPDAILICREIGSGIVPLEAENRLWREENGAFLRAAASRAEHVIRIFAGIPEVLR